MQKNAIYGYIPIDNIRIYLYNLIRNKVEIPKEDKIMLNENSKYNYKETKKAVKALVLAKGVNNILNADLVQLYNLGYGAGNVDRAMSYFAYSKQFNR